MLLSRYSSSSEASLSEPAAASLLEGGDADTDAAADSPALLVDATSMSSVCAKLSASGVCILISRLPPQKIKNILRHVRAM